MPIKQLIDELIQARKALEMKILAEMDSAANENGLDSFTVTSYGVACKRSGKEVRCDEIVMLEILHCNHIVSKGVQVYWEKGQGYV
jgi:hypothetical protein